MVACTIMSDHIHPVSRDQAKALFAALVGMPLSRLHLTTANSLFVELGELDLAGETGEVTICMECQWRVESARSIHVGSGFKPTSLLNRLDKLTGCSVQRIGLESGIPELTLRLSGGKRLRSCTVDETQPKWGIKLGDERFHGLLDTAAPDDDWYPWIGVKGGRLEASWFQAEESMIVIIPARHA